MSLDIKPSAIMLIAGGAVMLLSTFLAWLDTGFGSLSGWSTDAYGLTGIFVALIGIVVAGGTVATTFANVSLPDEILGFTRDQFYCMLGLGAFLITFGLQFGSSTGIGILLGWIASGVVVAGAFMNIQAAGTGATAAAPPSQF